ncbi:MAG TPA: PH domain-containing protein [Ornithinibacter sp.]|nr:PH domain-containing protein [Ornithinibacter sp.]
MTDPGPRRAGEWQRLHPLSPLLRGGVVLIAVLGYTASQFFDRFLRSLGLENVVPGPDIGLEGEGDDGALEQVVAHPFLALLALVLLVAGVAAVNWVSWRFSRFRVGDGQVELRQGVVFRQHRQVRLERVQAVELSRPILARLFGLARVVVQSAGGSDSQLTLSFIELGRAESLREHLLDLAGQSEEAPAAPDPMGDPASLTQPTSPTPDAGHRARAPLAAVPVVEVPNGRLFVATILHGSTIFLGVVLFGALITAGVMSVGPLALAGVPAMLPAAFFIALNRGKEMLTHGNFRLADVGTGVRVTEGLTDLRTMTIPLHRIQALEIVQPVWWRPVGWWRVRVNVAGVGSSGSSDGEGERETTLLPVGTLAEAQHLLRVLAPRVPTEVWTDAVLGDEPQPGWQTISPRAKVLDPLSWRRNGWSDTDGAVLLRSGRLTRRAIAVPHARIQSVTMRQGWLQARLGVASTHVVPAPGPISPVIAHLAVADAQSFFARVSERARVARRSSGPAASPLAPDPAGLVDWTQHPSGAPEPGRLDTP